MDAFSAIVFRGDKGSGTLRAVIVITGFAIFALMAIVASIANWAEKNGLYKRGQGR